MGTGLFSTVRGKMGTGLEARGARLRRSAPEACPQRAPNCGKQARPLTRLARLDGAGAARCLAGCRVSVQDADRRRSGPVRAAKSTSTAMPPSHIARSSPATSSRSPAPWGGGSGWSSGAPPTSTSPRPQARLLYEDTTPPPSPEEQAMLDLIRLAGPRRRGAPPATPDRRERRRLRREKEGARS